MNTDVSEFHSQEIACENEGAIKIFLGGFLVRKIEKNEKKGFERDTRKI